MTIQNTAEITTQNQETSKAEEVKSLLSLLEQEVGEPIREIGETITCSAKDDHGITKARIVPNMSDNSTDNNKWLYISQGRLPNIVGVSLTLKSLKEIIQWAETKKE
jgi:hypothetical protein